MKRFTLQSVRLLSTFVVTLALAGCGPKRESAKEGPGNLPPAQVRVQKVEEKARIVTEEVVGTVRAKLQAKLEARLSGRIEKMPVALGDKIQKGQLVARLDAKEIPARLEQAEAALEEAERNWKRVSALYEQQSVTRADYDAAQSRQRVAKGAVAESRAMLDYVEIVSPFDGVVTKKWAEVGDLAAPGKPLVDIEDPSALQVEAAVPEAIAACISRNAKLRIRVDASASEYEGVVAEISPAADAVSRTFVVKLDLAQTPGLRPGQFARLAVPVGESKSIRVPAAALVQRGQLDMVFSMTNQRARMHLVKTGKRLGDEIEILSGLEPGHLVVVNGADQLADGQPLEAK